MLVLLVGLDCEIAGLLQELREVWILRFRALLDAQWVNRRFLRKFSPVFLVENPVVPVEARHQGGQAGGNRNRVRQESAALAGWKQGGQSALAVRNGVGPWQARIFTAARESGRRRARER